MALLPWRLPTVLPRRMLRAALSVLMVGGLALASLETWAAGVKVPSSTRLPSLKKGSRHHPHSRHHLKHPRECPTPRGGDNDQNGNGIDDRCDTGAD